MRERLMKLLWLKGAAPFAWIPAFFLSIISTYYAYQNYTLQQVGNHPELFFTQVSLDDPYDKGILDLQMRNVGTRSAYRLHITVRTVHINSGQTITLTWVAGSNTIQREATLAAQQKINVKQFLGVLVLCTEYFDDADKVYEQVTYYRFPNLKPELTKEQRGSGVVYNNVDIFPKRDRDWRDF